MQSSIDLKLLMLGASMLGATMLAALMSLFTIAFMWVLAFLLPVWSGWLLSSNSFFIQNNCCLRTDCKVCANWLLAYPSLQDDPVCVAARDDGKTLVTDLWVEASLEVGSLVDARRVSLSGLWSPIFLYYLQIFNIFLISVVCRFCISQSKIWKESPVLIHSAFAWRDTKSHREMILWYFYLCHI